MTDLKKYQEELEKCSKCGFCQAFCPVYSVTGKETEVARGRNAQLLAFLRGELSLSEIEPAISTCLLCRACVPSCFTGVKTDELVRAGRETFVNSRGGNFAKTMVFHRILPHPTIFAALLKTAFFFKRLGLSSLAKKMGLLPEGLKISDSLMDNAPKSFMRSRTSSEPSMKGTRIAYFRSCGFGYFLPETGGATIKLIEGLGYEVIIAGNNCCGLPPYAHGYTEAARNLARKNIDVLEGCELVLTECGSCSSFLKEYAKILSDDPEYAERAKRLSGRVVDSNEFFFRHISPQPSTLSPKPSLLKVTYHDPCHLSRYQGITREPRDIIRSIKGIEFVELPEADWCCGGAGTYSITNNDISMKVLERKINNIKKTGAAIVATSCPACMIQLSFGVKKAGLNIKVMHVNQLLALSLKP